MREEQVVIGLRLPRVRYAAPAAILAGLGVFTGWMSTWASLVLPNGDLRAQKIGRVLMSVDRIGGLWPVPVAVSVAFIAGAAFLVWALVARRAFELRIDSSTLTWPSLAPWRAPYALPLKDIQSVECNAGRDHLVLNTARGRRLIPAWWIPPDTSLERVLETVRTRLA